MTAAERQEMDWEVRGHKVQGEKFQCTFKITGVKKKNKEKKSDMSVNDSG